MTFPMIAARVFGTPLLVDPAKGAAFLAGLGPRLVNGTLVMRGLEGLSEDRVARAGRVGQRASIIADDVGERARGNGRRLYRVRDGVAVIEVTGTLVHRGDWIGESSGTTSYEGLAAQVNAAAQDPVVRGIALEIDTFGGEVAGAFDLADLIRSARATKPVYAFVAEAALSAGYVIASQADRIVVPRTGEVGSIGVLCIHADYSQRLSDEGIAVTLIHAGAHKVDGNPYEALPDDVRADLQASVENSWRLFARTVEAGRGSRLSADRAMATEARVFRGEEAVAAGLADEVSDLRSAFAAFVAKVNGASSAPLISTAATAATTKGREMAHQTSEPTAVEASETSTTEATQPEAVTNDAQEQQGATAPTAGQTAATITVAQAAELVEIGQQAARLGITVDVAEAMKKGTSPDALRASVLAKAAATGEAASVIVNKPAPAVVGKVSPLVAAAKQAAQAQLATRRH